MIYVNSLFALPFTGEVKAFADDLAFAYGSTNPLNLVADINHDVYLLRLWFAEHKLVVSNKTKLIYFGLTMQESPDIDIIFHASSCCRHSLLNCAYDVQSTNGSYDANIGCSVNCFKIEIVEHYKYLGVIIDNTLSIETISTIVST